MDFERLRAAIPGLNLREVEFLDTNFELLLRVGDAARYAANRSPWIDEPRTLQLIAAAAEAINAARAADAAAEDARVRKAAEDLEAKYGPKPPLDPMRAVTAPAIRKHEAGTCPQCGGDGGGENCPACGGNGIA